ncbi:NAD+ synthase (glutamine-hydrolysing) [Nitratiruptor sp. YY08-26]|uniref:NAD(+) synthase n=1 Tax=unclassified Nitratiruptor TaxID=2624044 RepID=UPI0019155C3A|nr:MULTISPECIES: NAD(+) synthase [unclassified Nitratiruptor]BCD61788.1 NAD+ synthase (glutamine-hydrolysing) [Nitratiruptor sp. YY08-13]BCD65723.1 NAD+ synthase (glutamine-hydrolysing) [Nitratiruptor sp. YY08-26]
MSFYRVAAVSPKLSLGDIAANVATIKELMHAYKDAAVIVFPELCITGYTMGDLFLQQEVEKEVLAAIEELRAAAMNSIVIVGAPLWFRQRLYNCAVVLQNGEIRGIVPKSYLPNYREFYEMRWFVSGKDIHGETLLGAPFGIDLLFQSGELVVGVEICEDLWSVIPPSLYQTAAGANLICNLSASDEVVGKSAYRTELVRTQSARGVCAYVYASSGVGESSADVCYSGATLIAENGALLAQGERFSFASQGCTADIDVAKLKYLRGTETSYAQSERRSFRIVACADVPIQKTPKRYYDPHPFVPGKKADRDERCKEIFSIQSSALARRIRQIGDPKLIIGISGGLDSTLALLVCVEACEKLGKSCKDIVAVSMPGFGTTEGTRKSAKKLATALGVIFQEIDIVDAVKKHFADIGHDESVHDVTFENAQARYRTMVLMDLANKLGGIVVGTGDLSEIALGFNTYNGDHMAMYNVNAGVPKTLVKYVIAWVASVKKDLSETLTQIIERPVSPELLPAQGEKIVQKTEEIIGPYELHDFFLYHFVKYGAEPKKLLMIAKLAFGKKYSEETIKKWLKVFIKRFFANQFKRDAMPDGVKVGTIALSPRGDWRMPSDVNVALWLKELEE